jgi:predicted dehydrogenase
VSTLRWLVVGIGDITTKRVLPAILAQPRSRLVGVVTRTPDKAAPYAVPAFTSLHEALQGSDADAVYVATPVALHAPQSIECLRTGRHVLCEKPMAMHYEEARSMVAEAERSGRALGIAYYRRTYRKVLRALELLHAGAIGRPVFAEATSHTWFSPAGTVRSWLGDPAMAGGGPLYDIASHRIDLMNLFFGTPARASGYRSTLVQPLAVEDNATVMIEYVSGPRALIDVRWHSRVDRDEFRIRGTDGEIELSPLNSPSLISPHGREELPPHGNLHYLCIENFAAHVLDGVPLRSSGTTALDTDLVTEWVLTGT